MPDPLDADDDREDPKGPPSWRLDVDAEALEEDSDIRNRWTGYAMPIEEGDDLTLRVSNPDAENGEGETCGPLSWLNSARVTLDPKEDAVHFSASIFDPRGGFGFTIRRIPGGESEGIIVIHSPYQGAGLLHQAVRNIRPGTVEVVHDDNLPPETDTAALLADVLRSPTVRGGLRKRRNTTKGRALWDRLEQWKKDAAKVAAATPIRVAMPEEE